MKPLLKGKDAAIMWQVKNSENVIDYQFIGEYYVKISCECGYQWAAIRRNGVMKRVIRVVKGHTCETEKGQD